MFDDHTANQTPMFVHLITICVGLIIAFGLQQIVAGFQRRRREKFRQAQQAARNSQPSSGPPLPPGDAQ